MRSQCSYCGEPPIYFRKYNGEYLCIKHFCRKIEKKVYKTIRPHLRNIKKAGLAVSGGKDSLVMAYIINKIIKSTKPFKNINILAIIVDEGIPGYRDSSIKKGINQLSKWGIKYRIERFEDNFNFTIYDIIERTGAKHLSCTYCGLFRRRVLEHIARKEKIDILFTGHNASDLAQTIILNMIQGNIKHLVYELIPPPGTIPRQYPLKYILEKEVTLYAYLKKIEYYDQPCPFTRYSIRNDIRNFLSLLENKRPGITYSILHTGEKIKKIHNRKIHLKECMECGYPTVRDYCKVCELSLKIDMK